MNRATMFIFAVSTVAFAAAGCDSATNPAPTAMASTAAPISTSAPASPSASAPSVADDGCPVGAATLIAARKRNAEIDEAILETKSLSDIDCYHGYAVAVSHPVQTQGDKAVLVFKYSGGVWSAINGGTADFCDGVVPAGVRKKLELCR